MKFDLTLPKRIGSLVFFIGALSVYPLYKVGDHEITVGFIAGCFIGLLNVGTGYLLIEYGFDKPNVTFLKLILGGMVARLLITPALVVVLIRVFQLHLVSLTASLFCFYFLFLVLEIMFLNKRLSLKKTLA